MYYVYLLQSTCDSLYVGYTKDLQRRFREHNEGKVASTRGKVWRIVYYEAYVSEADARRRERRLKDDGRARHQLYLRNEAGLHVIN